MVKPLKSPLDPALDAQANTEAQRAISEIDEAHSSVLNALEETRKEGGQPEFEKVADRFSNSNLVRLNEQARANTQTQVDGSTAVAENSQAAGEGAEQEQRPPRTTSPEDRVQRMREGIARANKQRERGAKELDKVYVGALTMETPMKLNDFNISASAERFLGVIDLVLFTLSRRGGAAIGENKAESLQDQFEVMIDEYLSEAKSAQAVTESLLETEKNSSIDDWIVPTYQAFAFNHVLHLKNRQSAKLVAGLQAWDRAIYALQILEWNDKAKSQQVAEMRQQERRKLAALFGFSTKTIQGMRDRTQTPPAPRLNAA